MRSGISKIFFVGIFALGMLVVPGCSSTPKRPPEVFTNRNAVSGQLDLANQAVTTGDYQNAQKFLDAAWRLAVSTDDPESRVRVLLARGNAFFTEGDRTTAANYIRKALAEAEEAHLSELVSASQVYLARGLLAEGRPTQSLSAEERRKGAEEAKRITLSEMRNLNDDILFSAFSWRVLGLAEKELGNSTQAEDDIKKAIALHEKNNYLEDAAYDWYLIASVRSKAGQYDSAIEALNTALGFDRRAENTNGLGMDWMALGDVEKKSGNAEQAVAAYTRAAEIFKAAFLDANVAIAQSRLESLDTK